MSEDRRGWVARALRPRWFSPRGFRLTAAALVVLFVAVEAAGLRAYTCVLCGQAPTGDPADAVAFGLGALYLVSYGGAVLAAPVLAIGSLVFAGLERLRRRRRAGRSQAADAA
ncbi:MAG: hypothetical protein ACODAJ_00435 [Planctomycetota bacterium]